jgi:hypothetical protein
MPLGKGTSAKSATGASMSKYDVEVEGRLKALEAAVESLQAQLNDKCSGGGGDCDEVVEALKAQFPAKFANL